MQLEYTVTRDETTNNQTNEKRNFKISKKQNNIDLY